jgi:hypothetical protein
LIYNKYATDYNILNHKMGASLAYLKEPNKEIEQETGSNAALSYAAGSMQGWRLNMVSPNPRVLIWLTTSGGRTCCHVEVLEL